MIMSEKISLKIFFVKFKCSRLFQISILKAYWKIGIRDPTGNIAGSQKTRKLGPGTLMGHQRDPRKTGKPEPGYLEKPENLDLSGTLRKPWGTVPQQGPKIGKAGPNVTLEKLYNFNFKFNLYLFTFSLGNRQQNLENKTSNTLISFHFI